MRGSNFLYDVVLCCVYCDGVHDRLSYYRYGSEAMNGNLRPQ